MVSNAPIRTLSHDRFTIEGYSRAAVQTYWRIPELKIGFDLGAQPWDFMGTSTWFVSHGHLDHLAALPVYVARRRLMKMDPPTIYLPDHAVEHVDRILQTYRKLDRGRLPCELIGIQPGDEIDISRELVVTVSATTHTVPSLGFVVWDRRHKLKPEFIDFPGDKIRDLRLSGQEVTTEVRIPLLGYLGDTSPPGLDNCPTMFDAKVLIAEMTFVAPDHRQDKIHKHGHMHLDDFVARRDKFNNDVVIASHFSTRYHDRQIREIVQSVLPDMLDGRLHLWL
ncbi:MAG TPA: MBL fold metallo-hydrolase [Pirellulaceae bacterium]|jgi:ribonuclease Z|nr:MBL fold metallo-hydrolase [Pirellulaceae bacterium]